MIIESSNMIINKPPSVLLPRQPLWLLPWLIAPLQMPLYVIKSIAREAGLVTKPWGSNEARPVLVG
jgi:hypothetical protein